MTIANTEPQSAFVPATEPRTHTIPFGRPMIGPEERAAVADVLASPTLTHGPKMRQFEQDFAAFTGAPRAVATSSCAAALQLGAMALGIRLGDEVVVAAQTHTATAHAIELCGARCIFADSELETGNVDPDAVEAAITPGTAAIAIVHYLGYPAAMSRILAIAKTHGVAVIEDCALAPGAMIDGTHVGLLGDVGCFSFYPVKHITTGEGGMLITRRPAVADQVERLRAFGIDRNVVDERQIPGMYDVQQLGMNCRLNEIGAAIGVEQLKKLPEFLSIRRRNFARLRNALRDVPDIRVIGADSASPAGNEEALGDDASAHACYCLSILLDEGIRAERDRIIESLGRAGIGASIYYPRPVPLMSYYRNKYDYHPDAFRNAVAISDGSIALPVGPHIGAQDVDAIAAAVRAAVAECRE